MIRAVIFTRRNRNACYPRLEASRPFWTFYLFIWLHLATFTILALFGISVHLVSAALEFYHRATSN